MTKTPQKHFLTFTPNLRIDIYMRNFFLNLQKLSLLLVSVFFLACETPTEIGYDFSNEANAKSFYTDSLSLTTSTVLSDSNVTGGQFYLMAGVADDPLFGSVKATAFFQPTLRLSSTGNVLKLNLVKPTKYLIDSVKISLINTGTIFGDTLPKCDYTIHRLKASMNNTKNYNGSDDIAYESEPLVKFSINSRSFKNLRGDSLRSFNITLPKSIAQEISGLDTVTLSDNAKFIKAFKGFAIVPNTKNKAVYSFNTGIISGLTSSVVAYLHEDTKTDFFVYQFELNGPKHSQLLFDRSNTIFKDLVNTKNELSSTTTANQTFVQSGSGISTKINLANITKLGTSIKVSKAIIEFKFDKTKIDTKFPLGLSYVMAEVKNNNQQLRNASNALQYLFPLGNDFSGSLGTLDSTFSTLTFDITYQLQKLANNTAASKELLILPAVSTSQGNGILSNDNLYRAVLSKPKFYIYYTSVKK
jgi:hypothetical protein